MIEETNARPKKGKKKKRRAPRYVELQHPPRLVLVSFAWALVGWVSAAMAPHLAFMPLTGLIHFLMPALTVGFIAVNLYFAMRDLRRGVHPLRLLVATGVQIALFTTLFFQLFAHGGAELFDAHGPTPFWKWLVFSLAHALRAWDVLDIIEAHDIRIEPVRHVSRLVAVFIIVYHMIVDVFFLGLLWEVIKRGRDRLLEDEGIRTLLWRVALVAFSAWFSAWVVLALAVRRWAKQDIPLWFFENLLRVVDFADVMESFDIRLHQLPREGVIGFLTILCRVWIALGIAVLLSRKKASPDRRLATPPETDFLPFWGRRLGVLAGMVAAMVLVGLVAQLIAGNPAITVAQAVERESEARSFAGLRALRRMGPTAETAVPTLVAMRSRAQPPVKEEITRTLGYLGKRALEPLREIALREGDAGAVAALAGNGAEAAPTLMQVWQQSSVESIRQQAGDALLELGLAAMGPLLAATNAENAGAAYQWFGQLDRNWRLRDSNNKTVRALQGLPDLLQRLGTSSDPEERRQSYAALKACGSAASAALPALIELLMNADDAVRTDATRAVINLGAPLTPKLLDLLGQEPSQRPPEKSLIRILGHAEMWDAAAVKHAAALPLLRRMLSNPEEFGLDNRPGVIAGLGLIGPPVRDTLPSLAMFLGHADPDRRAAVRQALAQLDPEWEKHPDIDQVLPGLLPHLSAMPAEEADELSASIGNLQPARVPALVNTVERFLANDPYNQRFAVFAGLERLGPRLQLALPALARLASDRRFDERTRARLLDSVKKMASDARTLLALPLPAKDAEMALKQAGADALPQIAGALDNTDVYRRLEGLKMARNAGPVAQQLLPKVLERLKDKNDLVLVEGSQKPYRTVVIDTLAARDKDWMWHPAALPGLAAAVRGSDHPQYRVQLCAALGNSAVPTILEHVRSPTQRPLALSGLQRIGPGAKDALPALKQQLADKDANARSAAVLALGALGKGQADLIALLGPRLLDASSDVRQNASQALPGIDSEWRKSPKLKDTLSQISNLLAAKDPKGRLLALEALFPIGPVPTLVPVLERVVQQERDPELKRRASLILDISRSAKK